MTKAARVTCEEGVNAQDTKWLKGNHTFNQVQILPFFPKTLVEAFSPGSCCRKWKWQQKNSFNVSCCTRNCTAERASQETFGFQSCLQTFHSLINPLRLLCQAAKPSIHFVLRKFIHTRKLLHSQSRDGN